MKQSVHPDQAFGAFYQVNPVALVTTVDATGRLNVAAKTQFTRIGLGRFIGFGCCPEHHTYANAVATGEFVVNFPGPDLVAEVGLAGLKFGEDVGDELARCGLTAIPSERVSVPRVEECWAHLECSLAEVRQYGEWSFIVGEVVAASVDDIYVLGGQEPKRRTVLEQGAQAGPAEGQGEAERREQGEGAGQEQGQEQEQVQGRRLVYPLLAYVYPNRYGVIREVKRFRFPEGYRG